MSSNRRDWLVGAGALSWLAACGAPSRSTHPVVPAAEPDRLLEPGLVYLNTGSVGPTSRAVRDAMAEAARTIDHNPVRETYFLDNTVLAAAQQAHARAAALLGCSAAELLFTSGTTNGMNTIAQALRFAPGDRVITTDQEHEGGSLCWAYLAGRRGIVVDPVAVTTDDTDETILRKLEAAITPATRVLSASHILYTTGRLMPVAAIAALARAHGLLCVIDGAQAAGNLVVDVKQLGCHAYATSGHKWLLGPVGTGLLYISAEAGDAIRPIQWQGGHGKLVGEALGLVPLPQLIGLGVAIDETVARGIAETQRHNVALRERAYAALATLPKVRIVSPRDASALITCALPPGTDGKALIRTLAAKHRVQLKAIDHGFVGLRFTPHVFNTAADVDAAVRAVAAELG